MKGLDHIVLCVNDLDGTADIYRQLGFTVTPRAKHPFGTHNCIIQLDRFFLEILTIAEPDKIPAEKAGHFGFASFNQRYLATGQGPSMLVLDSSDFRADNVAAQEAGLQTYEPFQFSRNAVLPSQEVVEVSFALNFVSHPEMTMAAFFTCQQFQPEYFWKPEYQRHKNSASQIVEICMVADQPAKFAGFMSAFCQIEIKQSGNDHVTIETARGRVAIVTPEIFKQRYGMPAPDLTNGSRLAGMIIGTKNIAPQAVAIAGTAIVFEQTG